MDIKEFIEAGVDNFQTVPYGTLICKMPLPTEAKEGCAFDLTQHEWETREFKAIVEPEPKDYEITADGELYSFDDNDKRKKSEFTGYINFFEYIRDNDGDKDLSVEFQVQVILGKVEGEIECLLWREEENKERKALEKKIKKELEKRLEKVNTWYFKWILYPWNIVVDLTLTSIARLFNWISMGVMKLRDWLIF